MITTDEIQALASDGVVIDQDGDKVGKVGQIYLDDTSGEPSWVTASTGFFGTSQSFVPLQGAHVQGSEVRVAYAKDVIKDAPRVDEDASISPEEERTLFQYYGIRGHHGNDENHDRDPGHSDLHGREAANTDDGVDGVGHVGQDRAHTDEGPSMTRSEEQVQVGTEKVNAGKARLRKYVVTENVTKTVPVQREEVRIEREPIAEGDRSQASSPGGLGDDEQEVSLSEERVVVDKETVPVEKVKMDTDTVTEDRQVTEEVRKEQVDTDLPESEQGLTDENRH